MAIKADEFGLLFNLQYPLFPTNPFGNLPGTSLDSLNLSEESHSNKNSRESVPVGGKKTVSLRLPLNVEVNCFYIQCYSPKCT